MKKIVFLMLLILVGVGAYFAWKMLKGDGGCCGWGGDNTDPWSSYTPPARKRPPRPDLSRTRRRREAVRCLVASRRRRA